MKTNTRISINWPDDIYATVAIMPTLRDLGLKLLNDDLIKYKKTIFFICKIRFFLRYSLSKKKRIDWFANNAFNERPNEILATDYETQKTETGKKWKKETKLKFNFVNIVDILCYIY